LQVELTTSYLLALASIVIGPVWVVRPLAASTTEAASE
jgi:hypothetical protein